ncbi:helix-turn-helix domain-containing protein [Sphingomonas sp.]|uniref:helix-turn-helix domain-containing protein n=1 Tax=Sphingomonas sp. TaxID=28214 RepID=UPI0025FD80CB|nr:helix-turn-helix domain-containing protein [Sphingomonas sp.]
MDETEADDVITVGQRLKEAREAKGLSVEDVAAQTRIPTRHLTSLEQSDWDKLPAATYSIGFAKNFAGVVGLDRTEIGDALREEMGDRLAAAVHPEVYEAVDPARTMPKGLVLGALGLLVLVVLGLMWFSNRSMQPDQAVADASNVAAPAQAPPAAPPPVAAPAAAGPVVLTATAPAWIQVTDGGKSLFSGELAPGQAYTVPATATAPLLKAGKPEALRVTVGTAVAPQVGPAGKIASNVSLLPADLMKGPAQPAAAPATIEPAAPGTPQSNVAAPATTN